MCDTTTSYTITSSANTSMCMYNKFIPVVVSALTVLILGMWNPSFLQHKVNGRSLGSPDPKLLAVAALGSGAATALLLKVKKPEKYLKF